MPDGRSFFGEYQGDWRNPNKENSKIPKPDAGAARYVCSTCAQELFPQHLLYVRFANHGSTNLKIMYRCFCSIGAPLYAIYPFNPNALFRMFGTVMDLPWPESEAKLAINNMNKMEEGEGIPQWRPEDETTMQRWDFDLEGVDTADDFLKFADKDRHRDDGLRKRFREENPGH